MKQSPADRRLHALAATLGALLLAFLIVPLVQLSWVSPLAILELFTVPEVREALILTFSCAAAAATIGLVFAGALGYWLAKRPVWISRILLPLIDIPLLIPHPVAGIALLLLLARPGLLNRLLESLHLSPGSGSLLGTPAAIIAAMVFVSAPYQVQVCRQAFAGLDPAYALRARTLGAGPWRTLLQIELPLVRRNLLGGAAVALARSASEFGAILVVAYFPRTLPVLIYERFSNEGLDAVRPLAALMIIAGLLLQGVLHYLQPNEALEHA
ncbi:Molybdenum transport system permease protein ModB [Acidisarcina polymorpha]|uniref:Molybdenum transport system permease protein ModB n=1 Tax=Acidisarcina polymorpha TaxID=2211140 RepID=A0A2Z5FS52_9BACT|nr:ABC transporter permease [Acidisarcina polymorpha]AXC09592.1 Molybdenum transport system permease protein ModB [Acidisarcina polymorpha]